MEKSTKVYFRVRSLCRGIARMLFRYSDEGSEKIPAEGPVLFSSNHQSFLDPVLIGAASPRMIAFMSRKDLFKYPVLSWLLPNLHVIPLERGSGDVGAVKAAIRALKAGSAFGIFPEGRRSRTGVLEPFKSGAAAIAMRTGATIVPVGIAGSKEAWGVGKAPKLFSRIHIKFGDPIFVEASKVENAKLEALTKQIQSAVESLLPPEYAGNDAVKSDEIKV